MTINKGELSAVRIVLSHNPKYLMFQNDQITPIPTTTIEIIIT